MAEAAGDASKIALGIAFGAGLLVTGVAWVVAVADVLAGREEPSAPVLLAFPLVVGAVAVLLALTGEFPTLSRD